MNIGAFLRRLRIANGEILKTMAEKLGVSSAFLSAVENGKKKMPESWHEKLFTLYNLNNQQREELVRAALLSNDTVEINIVNATCENKNLAVIFARRFDDIDKETSQKIIKLLNQTEED